MTASPRLRFLADTVIAEAEHLQTTDGRLFAVAMTPERAARLRTDIDLAERTDAFVARLGRLQDTEAEKLLPALLDGSAERALVVTDGLIAQLRKAWARAGRRKAAGENAWPRQRRAGCGRRDAANAVTTSRWPRHRRMGSTKTPAP